MTRSCVVFLLFLPWCILGSPCVQAQEDPCCSSPLTFFFQDRGVGQVSELFAADLRPTCDDASEEVNTITLPVADGESASFTVFVGLVSNLPPGEDGEPGQGVMSWDVGIGVEGNISVGEVITEGTVGDLDTRPPGLRDSVGGNFNLGGIVDPQLLDPETLTRQGPGVYKSVILSYAERRTLEPVGTATLLELRVQPLDPSGRRVQSGTLEFAKRLTGSSVCENTVVIDSERFDVCATRSLRVRFVPASATQLFRRGDVNLDSSVDISDGIFVLNFLFSGGEDIACEDSADVDDGGDIDITDAVALFTFLFGGAGGAKGLENSECDVDPTDDFLTCFSFEGC